MKNIREFFSRVQNKQLQEFAKIQSIKEVIARVAKVEIEPSSITIRGGDIVLRGLGQTEKSEIYLKKNIILKNISLRIRDIRF